MVRSLIIRRLAAPAHTFRAENALASEGEPSDVHRARVGQ